MTPMQKRILDWLDRGHVGTAREIADGLGAPRSSVLHALPGIKGQMVAIESRRVKGGLATVWAKSGTPVRQKSDAAPIPEPPPQNVPMVQKALRSRTALERAWR